MCVSPPLYFPDLSDGISLIYLISAEEPYCFANPRKCPLRKTKMVFAHRAAYFSKMTVFTYLADSSAFFPKVRA